MVSLERVDCIRLGFMQIYLFWSLAFELRVRSYPPKMTSHKIAPPRLVRKRKVKRAHGL